MTQLTRQEAEEFLYKEAKFLDERRFEEWLDLLADDAYYWMPSQDEVFPHEKTPIMYYDRSTVEDWVFRLRNPRTYSQSPPSKTLHLISNVHVNEQAGRKGDLMIYSNFILYETRKGEQRSFAGQCEHYLRREKEQWKITLKKIKLINRDHVMYNLTFIF